MSNDKKDIKDKQIALEVKDVWESFRIYHQRNQTLKEALVRFKKSVYEEFWALKGVSFKVHKGETLGIIGENGSGKSTLLKCISGILQPSKGKIVVNGKISPLLELGAGFHPELSGRENIYVNGAILGLTKKQIDKKFNEIVDFSELRNFIDTQVKNYSSGMYIRLGFAIAVFSDPDILVIDEVLSVGDQVFKKKSFDKIKELQSLGKTIIFVTHDLNSTLQFCDKLILLKQGTLKKIGKPKEIIRNYMNTAIVDEKSSEKGSKEIYLNNIQLLNQHGSESRNFNPGESMTIKAGYIAKKSIDNPVFGIAIHDTQGNLCFGTNSNLLGITTGKISDSGEVSLHLNNLPMPEGKFYITLAITSIEGENYHWLDHFLTFEINNNAKSDGFLHIPVECKINTVKSKAKVTN